MKGQGQKGEQKEKDPIDSDTLVLGSQNKGLHLDLGDAVHIVFMPHVFFN